MCINPEVMQKDSNAEKVHLCRAKVHSKTCGYYRNLDGEFCFTMCTCYYRNLDGELLVCFTMCNVLVVNRFIDLRCVYVNHNAPWSHFGGV